MNRQQLQEHLRSFEPMKGVEVHWPDMVKHALAPNLVTVQGIVSVKGEPHMYALDVDLLSLKTREDVEWLVKALLSSFEKAERGVGVTHHG